jgi:hypothetical protein
MRAHRLKMEILQLLNFRVSGQESGSGVPHLPLLNRYAQNQRYDHEK